MELIPIIEYTLLIFIAVFALVLLFSFVANRFSGKEDNQVHAYQKAPVPVYIRSNSQPQGSYSNHDYEPVNYADNYYNQYENYQPVAEIKYANPRSNRSSGEITKRFTLLNELNTGLPVVDENKLKLYNGSQGSAAISNRTVLFK